jgi:hypothetical protein
VHEGRVTASHRPRILSCFGALVLLALSACNQAAVPGDGAAATPSPDDQQASVPPVQSPSGEVLEMKRADVPEMPPRAGPLDPHPPKCLTPTPTGLYYRILRQSHGRQPVPSDRVVVDYEGWLETGEGFDSSYERKESLEIDLSKLIAGLTEGLQLIGEGGMIELEIPPALAYGDEGMAGDYPVPPNATVHFVVELHEIR